MLVLTRLPNQHLRINEEIKVGVIKVDGGSVSLGIIAPQYVSIVRSERKEGEREGRVEEAGTKISSPEKDLSKHQAV